jgi:PTHB1 N-terminus
VVVLPLLVSAQAKVYDHQLGGEGAHFTAYNMTHGPFGGVNRDLLAVQSMDGRLQVNATVCYISPKL